MANMLFANNCNTTLSGSLTNVATTMSVTSATGFPSPTGSQYFYCTLADAATQTTIEIVKVTAVSGTTFTIVRGQDGTSGTAFASGAVVSLRLVRASLNDFPKLDEANTFTQLQTINTIAVSGSTSTTPVLSFNASNCPIASGTAISGSYLQFVLQNTSGTASASTNYVLSNELGTDSSYYGEFGMNSSVYSSGTPADFFSINNGVYFSGHDGDITVGSGNGKKLYLAWGTSGQSAHVINASGAIGLNTNLASGTGSGTTNFGTAGQPLLSGGSSATPTWGTLGVAGGGTGLTSLTAGYIPFGNGTSAFNSASYLFWDNTNIRLGVGTSSPNYKLHVVTGVAGNLVSFTDGIAQTINFITTSTGVAWNAANGGYTAFQNAGTEVARFDSSGNLLLGTTSASTYSAGGKFYSLPTGTTNPTGISTGCWATSGNAINFFSGVGTGVAYAGAITLNGSVTLYTSASDRRLKSNIIPITGADSGPIIDALKPCSFTMNSNGSVEKGFIADEFQTVISGAVFGEPNQVDENGNPVYQAIDSASPEVIAYLVAEIQSLRARLKAANIA